MYTASGHETKTVMVAGQVLVRDEEMLTAAEDAVCAEAYAQAGEVVRRVIPDPVHKEMALSTAMETGRL